MNVIRIVWKIFLDKFIVNFSNVVKVYVHSVRNVIFYLHVDKNGHTIELGPPRRRQRMNARERTRKLLRCFYGISLFQ